MSVSPDQMQQMLAMYKAQFPGQMAASMGNAPAGTTQGAGAANGLSKLALAMIQQKRMQQLKQQLAQPQAATAPAVPPPGQGQTLSAPPAGMPVGVPTQ
jgi:hypothetical protein